MQMNDYTIENTKVFKIDSENWDIQDDLWIVINEKKSYYLKYISEETYDYHKVVLVQFDDEIVFELSEYQIAESDEISDASFEKADKSTYLDIIREFERNFDEKCKEIKKEAEMYEKYNTIRRQ